MAAAPPINQPLIDPTKVSSFIIYILYDLVDHPAG